MFPFHNSPSHLYPDLIRSRPTRKHQLVKGFNFFFFLPQPKELGVTRDFHDLSLFKSQSGGYTGDTQSLVMTRTVSERLTLLLSNSLLVTFREQLLQRFFKLTKRLWRALPGSTEIEGLSFNKCISSLRTLFFVFIKIPDMISRSST